MKRSRWDLLEIVFRVLSVSIWVLLALIPVAGLLGFFNPARY